MAIITIPVEDRRIEGVEAIADFMTQNGLWYERWNLEKLPPIGADQETILSCYSEEITRLNQRGGYTTADVIDVGPATPGLDAMLQKFSPEHTHNEDEVRFVVRGRGIFHINPIDGPVFAVEMESGDLINVPAGTRHWFNLCEDKTIVTIRLFQETTGWAPHYVADSKHLDFLPLCFGPKKTLKAPTANHL